ncbi:DNA binding domain protein, excisionase family (plasmid) [Peptoclostridium acidaminophilum DSM 3953]|uniref:DNA binding domain protein, excisionase family n=1 Tax=Peptoclostridium acidaminophilum DSM 3953 TaxID=1286171 RepID=W8TNR9_PEPAC|nr:helix-turn-helix transcriptional regulator [Peptoclostridium acidaminophilum]AHM57807.1 DNA binding domain protein, excisionase family [Peptoclostridium acidaminophilum DSM 3953]
MSENTALTPQEVADILKITKNTVYQLVKRGELSAYRVGNRLRIDYHDVLAYKNKTISLRSDMFENPPSDQIKTQAKAHIMTSNLGVMVISGKDILLDILARHIEMHPNGFPALRSYTGSYNGLYALYQGNVHLATAHLWDGDTGEYNTPFVRRMLPGIPAAIVHLACRIQGFYVQKGNPKGIKDWLDFKRDDIKIVNREKGSGTRVLLDENLRLLGIQRKTIRGYEHECTSHLAAASTVARCEADIGIGSEKTAQQVGGIDFIPIQKEKLEMIIIKEDWELPAFQTILQIVRSPEFRAELEGIGGYDLSQLGKIVAET